MSRIRLPPNPPKFDWKELTDNFAQQYTIYNIHTERKIITQVFLIHLDLALPQNDIESLATRALINCCCWLWRSVRFHFASCCMNGFHLCFCFVDTSWSWKPTLQRPITHYKLNFFDCSLTVLCLQFHQPVKKNCFSYCRLVWLFQMHEQFLWVIMLGHIEAFIQQPALCPPM